MNLDGRTAVITGGNTGMGRILVRKLAGLGANVVINYVSGTADEIVDEIKEFGGNAIAVKADVTKLSEVENMADEAVKQYGGIHYLINNAGTTCSVPFENIQDLAESDWDKIFAVHIKGAFNCVKAIVPVMKKAYGCAIVNIGSTAGITGIGSSLPYAVSKGALHSMTKSLANILAPDIRVNCVSPGPMETEWWIGRENYVEKLSAALPMKRLVQPEEAADTVIALLEIEAFTGQIVSPNCGRVI